MTPHYLAYLQRKHWREYPVRERLYMRYSATVGGDNPNGYCHALMARCLKLWRYTEVEPERINRDVDRLALRICERHPRATRFYSDVLSLPWQIAFIDGDRLLVDGDTRAAMQSLTKPLRRISRLPDTGNERVAA